MDLRILITIICLFLCLSCSLTAVGLKFVVLQDVEVKNVSYCSEKTVLRAYLVKPNDISLPAPSLIIFHGFSSSKELILPLSIEIAKKGYIILLPDLRGHGKSEGKMLFDFDIFTRDVEAGLDFLEKQEDVDPSRIGFLGQSLGGAIALIGGAILNVSTVVSISTFANITKWSNEVGFLGISRISYFLHSDFPQEKDKQNLFSPIAYVQNLSSLLVIHGSNDQYIPNHHSKDLYDTAIFSGVLANHSLISNGDHDLPLSIMLSKILPWLKNTLNLDSSLKSPSETPQLVYLSMWGFTAASFFFFFITVLSGGYLLYMKWLKLSSVEENEFSDSKKSRKKVFKYIGTVLVLYIFFQLFSEIGFAFFSPTFKIEGGFIVSKVLLIILIVGITHFTKNLQFEFLNDPFLKIKLMYTIGTVLSVFLVVLIFGPIVYFPSLGTANTIRNMPVLFFIAAAVILDEIIFRQYLYRESVTLALKGIAECVLHVTMYMLSKLLIIASFLFMFNLFELRLLLFVLGVCCIIGTFTYSLRRYYSLSVAISFSLGINLLFYLTLMTTLFVS